MVNFSINTTYKQPILLNFRSLSPYFEKSGRDGKKWFSRSYSTGEKLSDYWNFIIVIFLKASVINNKLFRTFGLLNRFSYTQDKITAMSHEAKLAPLIGPPQHYPPTIASDSN